MGVGKGMSFRAQTARLSCHGAVRCALRAPWGGFPGYVFAHEFFLRKEKRLGRWAPLSPQQLRPERGTQRARGCALSATELDFYRVPTYSRIPSKCGMHEIWERTILDTEGIIATLKDHGAMSVTMQTFRCAQEQEPEVSHKYHGIAGVFGLCRRCDF